MRARAGLALGVLLAMGLAACGDDPTGGGGGGPVPGEMVATMASPNGGDASALLEVASGEVRDAFSDDPGLLVVFVPTTPVRIVALRGTPGPIAFRILAADVAHPPEVRVIEVGGADDALRSSLNGYVVTLARAGGS